MPAYCPGDELSLCKLSRVCSLHQAVLIYFFQRQCYSLLYTSQAIPCSDKTCAFAWCILLKTLTAQCGLSSWLAESAYLAAGYYCFSLASQASNLAGPAGENISYPGGCASAQVDRVFQPDTVREFLITRVDNRSGEVQLSIKRLETALLWQRLRQLRDYKVYYPAHVVSANQSGVLAEVHGQSGFIPGSHIPNVRALAACH